MFLLLPNSLFNIELIWNLLKMYIIIIIIIGGGSIGDEVKIKVLCWVQLGNKIWSAMQNKHCSFLIILISRYNY
jgi:hypothetical protein